MLVLCILIIKWNENTFFTLKGDFFFYPSKTLCQYNTPNKDIPLGYNSFTFMGIKLITFSAL